MHKITCVQIRFQDNYQYRWKFGTSIPTITAVTTCTIVLQTFMEGKKKSISVYSDLEVHWCSVLAEI